MAVTETENGFIVGADVLIGNVEHTVMIAMVDMIESDYGVTVETMLGDGAYGTGAYGTGAYLEAMEQRGAELLSPLPASKEVKDNPAEREDLTQPVADEDLDRLPINPQTKHFGKLAFVYDEQADCYYCPAGKVVRREGTEKARRGGVQIKVSTYYCKECAECELASRCRVNPNSKRGRKVTHDGFAAVRRRHRERMQTDSAKERYQRRMHFGETPFAAVKADLGLRQFLLRGIEGVRTEWLWACTTFNMKKLINLLAASRAQPTATPLSIVD